MTIIEIKSDDIIFDPKVQTYCNNPRFKCPNYNHSWACPPVAPFLDNLSENYDQFLIVYQKFNLGNFIEKEMKKHPTYDVNKIRNIFFRKQFMRDWIEKEILEFIKKKKTSLKEIFVLWDGHCRLCETQNMKCTYDDGQECRFPKDIRYSMEAVGINVTETVKRLHLEIEWPPEKFAFRFALICIKKLKKKKIKSIIQ